MKNLSSALSPQATSELEILWLDSDTLGMDGSQVGVFEEGDEISLSSFLESHNGRGLEAKVGLVI